MTFMSNTLKHCSGLKQKGCLILFSLLAACSVLLVPVHAQNNAQDKTLNPNYFYFFNGATIGNWGLILGDQDNWMLSVTGSSAESAGKQIELSRTDYKGQGDALHLKWSRKKGLGNFAIYGPPIDLSALESRAALTMEIKVKKRPKGTVSLGMDCAYPCRGEITIHNMLRKFELDEWTTFPVPINCFSANGLDVSNINAAMMLVADQPFEVEIANIRLELLPEGSPTCAS
jgi:hypothetical protein